MNVALKPAHLSLAQRIAKVRNCMLIEISTGVSVADKDLFVSLCQTYEQQNVLPSYLSSELRESLPSSFVSHVTQGTTPPSWPISALRRNIPSWQRYEGVLVTNQTYEDPDEDFDDWDKEPRWIV